MLPAQKLRSPAVDGLRAACCLIVVVYHAGGFGFIPYVAKFFADCAVMLFFTLSGYCMALRYPPTTTSLRYWSAYATQRFFRIYPPYALAALVLFALTGLPMPGYDATPETAPILLYNTLTLRQPHGMFWMMRHEIIFYAAYPLLACLLSFFTANSAWRVVACVWGALLVVNINNLPTPATIPTFFIGGVLAALSTRHPFAGQHPSMLASTGLFALLLVIILHFMEIPYFSRRAYAISSVLSPALFALALGATLAQGIWQRILTSRPATFLGSRSYSLYLIHIAAFAIATQAGALAFPAAILLTCLATLLFYRWFENPSQQLGTRLARRIRNKA